MSSIAAELNALATATVIDFYKRHARPDATDHETLQASKWATALWGLFACVVAIYAVNLGSLIEVVNRFGSFFYGSLLGVFMLAILSKRATATGALVAKSDPCGLFFEQPPRTASIVRRTRSGKVSTSWPNFERSKKFGASWKSFPSTSLKTITSCSATRATAVSRS